MNLTAQMQARTSAVLTTKPPVICDCGIPTVQWRDTGRNLRYFYPAIAKFFVLNVAAGCGLIFLRSPHKFPNPTESVKLFDVRDDQDDTDVRQEASKGLSARLLPP